MYRGRFAPTISGPLHFGSLITAVASYLDAKAQHGKWLLHIDDLDQPRVPPDAESQILRTLQTHGLDWDEEPFRQSVHLDAYAEQLHGLRKAGVLFYCTCSRKQRPSGKPYPGTCRHRTVAPEEPHAIRVRIEERLFQFDDRVQGTFQRAGSQVGDFVVLRRDGLASYPLSAVVDDALTRITHVVRGADLLENTINQIFLIGKLGLKQPSYAHVAVLNERGGVKLSKRNAVVAVDDTQNRFNLLAAMQLLGLDPPQRYSVQDLLTWGIDHWHIQSLTKQPSLDQFISI